jgi:dienelactone hydrolase
MAIPFVFRFGLILLAGQGSFVSSEEWSPEVFDYDRPARFEVRDVPDPGKLRIAGAAQQYFVFRDTHGQDVPVLIAKPKRGGPFPAVVLVHGYTSSKEQVTDLLGPELLRRGFATIAPDLPMHGARPGPPAALFADKDPKKIYDHLVQSVVDIRQAIDLVEAQKNLDTSKGVYMVGYSMGGWLAALAAGADRRVSAMVLMVPISEAAPLDPRVRPAHKDTHKLLLDRFPALRPTGAIARLSPRPVLIQAGELDGFLRKGSVDALLEAAGQPKQLRWYHCGHILSQKALAEAGDWLAALYRPPSRPSKKEGERG